MRGDFEFSIFDLLEPFSNSKWTDNENLYVSAVAVVYRPANSSELFPD